MSYLIERFGNRGAFSVKLQRDGEGLFFAIMLMLNILMGMCFAADMSLFMGDEDKERKIIINDVIPVIVNIFASLVSNNHKVNKWMFRHYIKVDLSETIIFTLWNVATGILIFDITDVKELTNYWCTYYFIQRLIRSVVDLLFPKIKDLFINSLFEDILERKVHTNNTMIFSSIGILIGMGIGFYMGDYATKHPIMLLTCYCIADLLNLVGNVSFFYRKRNISKILRGFGKSLYKWELSNKQN